MTTTQEQAGARLAQDEWLWGWDPTPGIVSVLAEPDGRAIVWRRIPETGALVRKTLIAQYMHAVDGNLIIFTGRSTHE